MVFRDLTKRELAPFYKCCYCGAPTQLMTYINDGRVLPAICFDCAAESVDLDKMRHLRALAYVAGSILLRQVFKLFWSDQLANRSFMRSVARCEARERLARG